MRWPTGRCRPSRPPWWDRRACCAEFGDIDRTFALASVTKPLVARAVQVAVEEGVVELDTAAGPPGSTVRHLLAHASGSVDALGGRHRRAGHPAHLLERGLRRAGAAVEDASEIPFDRYLSEAVFAPLGMGSSALDGGAAAAGYGAESTVADLAGSPAICCARHWCRREMHADAVSVQFPGLAGVLPGYGAQRPNDWGLGFEIRDGKSPHWTGSRNSAATFGHFGQIGHVHLGGSGRRPGTGRAHRPRLRRVGQPLWPAMSDGVLREFGAH